MCGQAVDDDDDGGGDDDGDDDDDDDGVDGDGDGDDYDGDGGQLLRRPMALVMAKFSLQLHPICHTCIHEADSGDNRI